MPLFDKFLADETYESTALIGLCDVTIKGEKFENERIRLDLEEGVVRIEATKFLSFRIPVGKPLSNDFIVSNIRVQSRGCSLTAENLDYTFISSVGGGSLNVANTSLANVTGFYSRPAAIKLVCNRHIEFKVDSEAFERRFFLNFDFNRMNLSSEIQLSGSKYGLSILGKEIYNLPNVDNALAIVVGARVGWASEWEGNILRIRLNSYKRQPLKARPIISTGDEWVSLDITKNNAEMLFPLALEWLNRLEAQQLTKALFAIDSLLSARVQGQNYTLSLFGVFRFWEWADKAKKLSKVPLAKCLQITVNEAQVLIDLRNDLIHGGEFFDEAIKKCDKLLREKSKEYVSEYQMGKSSASVLNYVHSLSANALMRIIGYNGETSKYFPLSGTSQKFVDNPNQQKKHSN